MGTPTQSYVDPSIAGDSGAGSIGDPWGDLQYGLNQITRDATNGDQFNVKAGTDEVLAAALDFTSYGAPAFDKPCIFRGYTSAANDGGIGGVSGAGSYSVVNGALDALHFKDMHLHNCGAADILVSGNYFLVVDCELDNTTGKGIVATWQAPFIAGNHLHNIASYGVEISGGGYGGDVLRNYFKNGTNKFTDAVRVTGNGLNIIGNIFSLDGSSDGIELTSWANSVYHNSILSASGTGMGIRGPGTSGLIRALNNLVEGFSGAGGVGINFTTHPVYVYGHSGVYNCTTEYNVTSDVHINLGDNESLGSSPFAKSGADTFANRFAYFAPNDVGNVQGGAYPSGCRVDKGAVQHADPAGGASSILGGGNLVGGFT